MTDKCPPEDKHAAAPARLRQRDVDGIFLLDKPMGISSNQALQRVKRLFRARKAGHTGSLDPLATGMLPICLGQATKVSAFLLDSDKTYRVRISFGRKTTTGDAEGAVVAAGPASVNEACLRRIIGAISGPVLQVPPMYSALKHQGRRLYELARAGKEVPRAARTVHIREVVLEDYDPEFPILRIRCGKGTYIRSLVEDIAEQAGTVGHVASLHRLVVEPFPEAGMSTLDALELAATRGGDSALDRLLHSTDRAIAFWPAVTLTGDRVRRLRCGQQVGEESAKDEPGMVRLYGQGGEFLGIGERLAGGWLAPRRLMQPPEAGLAAEFGL